MPDPGILTQLVGNPFLNGADPYGATPVDPNRDKLGFSTDQTLQAYNPSWRDKLGGWLLDQTSGSPVARKVVSGLVGSTGTGTTGPSVADFIPGVGQALGGQEAAQKGDYKGAALAMVPIPGAAELAPEANAAREGIIAYHGSPHSFDRFSLDKIGTGEGAQAFGHGLYFADSEGVAKDYRDKLSPSYWKRSDGELVGNGPLFEQLSQIAQDKGATLRDADQMARHLLDGVESAGSVQDFANNYTLPVQWKKNAPAVQAMSDHLFATDPRVNPGSMYQVSINANPDHFLDWDKPLSEQHPVVQKAVAPLISPERLALEGYTDPDVIKNLWADPSGSMIYKNGPLAGKESARTSQHELSAALRDAGIPGIKYLDAGSRSAGDGSRNYVVFNDKNIDIIKKYGLAGLLGLGGGGAMTTMPDDANAAPAAPEGSQLRSWSDQAYKAAKLSDRQKALLDARANGAGAN